MEKYNYIITELTTLASVNSDTGNIKLLSNFRNQIPELSKEIDDIFNTLGTISKSTISESNSISDIAKALNVADENSEAFLKTTQESNIVYNSSSEAITAYKTYLTTTGTASANAAAKTQLLTAPMQVLSSISWMTALTAVTWLINI